MANWTQEEDEFVRNNYLTLDHKEIGRILGKTRGAVRNRCYYLGLRKKAENWTESEIDLLKQHYSRTLLDLDELAKLLNRHKTNISRKARGLGLTDTKRPMSDKARQDVSIRVKRWMRENEHPRGYAGHEHGEQTRQVISIKSKESWANPNSRLNSKEERQRRSDVMADRQRKGILRQVYSRGNQGKRADLDGLYVRSSWEANYCRYLNWLTSIGQIKNWEYEVDTFEFTAIRRGTRFYTPDFKITNNDNSIEYHEIKGWMDQKSKTKLDRMKRYYPNVKIVLIDEDAYKSLARDVKRFILFWE